MLLESVCEPGLYARPGPAGDAIGALIDAYHSCILMHMRTTLILDPVLVERAAKLSGITEKTAVVHAGLEALIARESARRLAALGGTDARAKAPRRRRASGRAPR